MDDSEKLKLNESPTVPRTEKPLPDIGDVLSEVAQLSLMVDGGLTSLRGSIENVERSVKSRLSNITTMALEIQQRQVRLNEEQVRQKLAIERLREDHRALREDHSALRLCVEALEGRASEPPTR